MSEHECMTTPPSLDYNFWEPEPLTEPRKVKCVVCGRVPEEEGKCPHVSWNEWTGEYRNKFCTFCRQCGHWGVKCPDKARIKKWKDQAWESIREQVRRDKVLECPGGVEHVLKCTGFEQDGTASADTEPTDKARMKTSKENLLSDIRLKKCKEGPADLEWSEMLESAFPLRVKDLVKLYEGRGGAEQVPESPGSVKHNAEQVLESPGGFKHIAEQVSEGPGGVKRDTEQVPEDPEAVRLKLLESFPVLPPCQVRCIVCGFDPKEEGICSHLWGPKGFYHYKVCNRCGEFGHWGHKCFNKEVHDKQPVRPVLPVCTFV